jgi:hypothetical protein
MHNQESVNVDPFKRKEGKAQPEDKLGPTHLGDMA